MTFFTVAGVPVSKGRPRVVRNKRTGRVTTFTPSKTTTYEQLVALTAKAAGVRVSEGRMRVVVRFFLPDARPRDIDNLAKSVLDGLNGIAYRDDSQVRWLEAKVDIDKARPRAEVEVSCLDAMRRPHPADCDDPVCCPMGGVR